MEQVEIQQITGRLVELPRAVLARSDATSFRSAKTLRPAAFTILAKRRTIGLRASRLSQPADL